MYATIIWAYQGEGREGGALSRWQGCEISRNDVSLIVETSGRVWVETENEKAKVCFGTRGQHKSVSAEAVSIIFVHGGMSAKRSENLTSTLIIDYSSSDEPNYSQMLSEVEKATTDEEFIRVALRWIEFWRLHFRIDPIRRIKHRAMNLFAPLDTDCQYLLELWKRGEYDKARRHLEDMQKDWQGDPPYSNAPLSKLARLWYLLIGDKMKWSYQVTEVGDSTGAHISIKKPDGVISLPKERATDEVGMCFYDWLEKIRQTNSQNWQNLLSHAGLSESNNSFSPKSEAGIYRFAAELQKRVISNTLTELKPETPLQGFEGCKDVEQNFKEFRQWIRDLNNAFEALVEEIGAGRWTGDSSSSRGTSGDGG